MEGIQWALMPISKTITLLMKHVRPIKHEAEIMEFHVPKKSFVQLAD